MSKTGRESLSKLRTLVDDLCDRDEGIKRDVSLFEAVFHNFPVPVAIWLSDEKGHCVSRRVSGNGSRGWQDPEGTIDSVFSIYRCPELRKQIDRHFKRAVKGKQLSFLTEVEGTCVWTRLTPRFTGSECTGVIGISWDITANYRMYQILRRVEALQVPGVDLDSLKTEAQGAIGTSIIKKLLEEAEK
jgi:hypothetical protein